MIRMLSILIAALSLSICTLHAADNDDVVDTEAKSSSSSSKKRKLQEVARTENKQEALPKVAIDLGTLFREDVVVKLNLSYNIYLTDINFLLAFPTLTSLNLRDCQKLKDNYHPVSQLTNLTILDIRGIGLTTTEYLRPLINLTSLSIFVPKNCMKHIVQLPALKDLTLSGDSEYNEFGVGDSELDQLSELKSLEKLSLHRMFNNEFHKPNYICPSLDFLSGLIRLTTLDLSFNRYLYSINTILNLPNLTDLDLSGSKCLRDLREISKLKTLVKLNLDHINYVYYPKIKEDLEYLKELKNLRYLTLDVLTDTPNLSKEVIIHKRKGNFTHPTVYVSND